MLRSCAAMVAAVALLAVPSTVVHATDSLSLEDAFTRVIGDHPELIALRHGEEALLAEIATAAQRPSLTAGLEVENVLGTGTAAGIQGAELTVSLASMLERGGKRAARIAVAERRVDAAATRRAARRLDLLAEVAHRYLDAAAAEAAIDIAEESLARRERTSVATAERFVAGGAPEATRLLAEAEAERAAAELALARREAELARVRLAVLWGGTKADFAVDPLPAALPPVMDLAERLAALAQTPKLQAFADEARLREARLTLARSAANPDLAWSLGVRRMQDVDDWALVGSVSVPLGSAARAAPQVRAAEAEREAVAFEREATSRQLASTLAQAQARLESALATATQLGTALLPALEKAAAAAERAYRAGALDYLQWAAALDAITDARHERLEAAIAAHRAYIELQRLTGDSLRPTGGAHAEETTDATP